MTKNLVLFFTVVLFGCALKEKPRKQINRVEEEISWHLKDLEKDSVPGISLERLYKEYDIEDKGEEVIVALIDSQIDLYHEDFKESIYINENEIPGNNIDDDQNGYIDDVNGWNFLGIDRYTSIRYLKYAHIRFIEAHQKQFKGRDSTDIKPNESDLFKMFNEAKKLHQEEIDYQELINSRIHSFYDPYHSQIELMNDRIPVIDGYTIEQLDTVTTNNKEEETIINKLKLYKNAGITYESLQVDDKLYWVNKTTINRIGFNDRKPQGINMDDLTNTKYGSNLINSNNNMDHATQMAGIIAANRSNGLGIRGISNKIKIMPLAIWAEAGTEYEKDFYSAVKYAVDNGAKIINYSSGFKLLVHPEFYFKALKYAEKNDVLVVVSAGNIGENNDSNNIFKYYPLDYDDNGNVVGNVLHVSASTEDPMQVFAFWANFGKNSVDLLAPGDNITTTSKEATKYYAQNGGTSISAAITSGVAGILKSNFPNLSAKDLKKILMESGTSYDIKSETDTHDSLPFNSLTKSGKVLNALNAYKMAKSYAE